MRAQNNLERFNQPIRHHFQPNHQVMLQLSYIMLSFPTLELPLDLFAIACLLRSPSYATVFATQFPYLQYSITMLLNTLQTNSSSPGPSETPTRPCLRRSDSDRSTYRPTLDEVLTNTAPPPYTLSAFMAYLSQNHCLETLEFTLEANRYRETYDSFVNRLGESKVTTDASGHQRLFMLWQLLLTAYVLPGAPREINLSVDVRDSLLRHRDISTPPLPETLDLALKSVHDLMEDSIFFSFLNNHSASSSMNSISESSSAHGIPAYRSVINSGEQPTKLVRPRAKRSLNPLSRAWSWPPRTRHAD